MIRDLLQRILLKFGKTYTVDKKIPNDIIFYTMIIRVFMVLRGFLKTGKPIFIGQKVRIRNSKNIHFGKFCTIENSVSIDGCAKEKILLGNGVKIGQYSKVSSTSHLSKLGKGLEIGNNSAVGEYSYFGSSGGIKIGNDVIMGQYVSFHSENHNFNEPDKLIRNQGVTSKGIILGNNIWVGAKATFLDGSIIGNNCVVAAGAVVRGIFPDNSIIGGVPAKVIKRKHE